MRSAFALLLLLGACSAEEPGAMANGAADPAPGAPDTRFRCVLQGMTPPEQLCSVSYIAGPEGTVTILRRPDGGFRRLLPTPDGGYRAADGAEQPRMIFTRDNRPILLIGGDQYWIP